MIKKIIKSKKGWIRLVEVFVAILLLTGVLLVIINKNHASEKNTLYVEMSNKELAILRDIELNNTLRAEVLSIDSANLPIEWDNFGSELQNVKSRIINLTPSSLECKAKICSISENCIMEGLLWKDIYAKSIIISANLNIYSPRQLKLFCMEK